MEDIIIELMDDMHLSSKPLFLDYYHAMAENNVDLAQDILKQNPEIINQIINEENVNLLIKGVNERELQPKEDIDYFLNKLAENFQNTIKDTKVMGVWNAETQYRPHNLVYYNSKGYFCYSKIIPPIGTLPTDNDYWLEYDISGLKGYGGIQNLKFLGNWDSTVDYKVYDVVVFQNKMWWAIADNTNFAPNLRHYPWSLIMVPDIANKTPIQQEEPEGYNEGDFWFKITKGDDIISTAWTTLNQDQIGRFASSSFMIGDNIYVIGGQTGAAVSVNVTDAYDTITNTWSQKANYPVASDGMFAFSVNNIGYAAGGLDHNLQSNTDAYFYDPSNNTWTQTTSLPETVSAMDSVAVIGTDAYCIGSQKIYKFNTVDKTWSIVSNLPLIRFALSVEAIDNKLYLIGGTDEISISTGDVQIYDIATNTWSTGKEMITPRSYTASFKHDNEIYVVGGLDKSQYSLNINEVYNVSTNTWRNDIPMKYSRNSLNGEYTSDKGYAIGGINISRLEVNGYVEAYNFNQRDINFEMIVDTSLGTKTITIPTISDGTYDYIVDWGDGTVSSQITQYNDVQATHIYTDDGEYTIKLTGALNKLKFTGNIANVLKKVTKCTLAFISIEEMFNSCKNLVSVTEGIFLNSTEITSAYKLFYGCTALKNIPKNIFLNNKKITSFEETFNESGLEEIPMGLFDGNNLVTTFNKTFRKCNFIKIPSGLFINNYNVTNFSQTFISCHNLKTIPENLFGNCSLVTTYSSCFYDCINLETIPENLFGNNGGLVVTADAMFADTNISTIPEGLFKSFENVTNYNTVFSSKNSISSIPKNLFNGNNATWENAFPINDIISLDDNSLIGLNITSDMFKNKIELKTVGDNVFWKIDTNTIQNNPTELFNGCTSLVSVGNINFSVVSEEADLTNMFSNCTSLQNLSGFKDKEENPTLKSNISFSNSPLTYNSLVNLIDSLVTNTLETKKTLTLGNANLELLSDEEKLLIINKYWDLPGYTVAITEELATSAVKYIEGYPNLIATLYKETNAYFYVRLYDGTTDVDYNKYAINKTTGYIYLASDIQE